MKGDQNKHAPPEVPYTHTLDVLPCIGCSKSMYPSSLCVRTYSRLLFYPFLTLHCHRAGDFLVKVPLLNFVPDISSLLHKSVPIARLYLFRMRPCTNFAFGLPQTLVPYSADSIVYTSSLSWTRAWFHDQSAQAPCSIYDADDPQCRHQHYIASGPALLQDVTQHGR